LGHHDAGVTVLVVGLAVLAVSIALWRNLDRTLQFLSCVAGVGMTAIGFDRVLHLQLTFTEAGALVWCAALVLGFLGALRVLRPALVVEIVAELGVFEGALAITNAHRGFGLALGMATAGSAVGAGLVLKRTPMVVVAILGFLVFLVRTLGVYLHGIAAALGIFVVGVVLVLAAIRFGTRKSGATPGEVGPPAKKVEALPPPLTTAGEHPTVEQHRDERTSVLRR
jgi:hypothetical protein